LKPLKHLYTCMLCAAKRAANWYPQTFCEQTEPRSSYFSCERNVASDDAGFFILRKHNGEFRIATEDNFTLQNTNLKPWRKDTHFLIRDTGACAADYWSDARESHKHKMLFRTQCSWWTDVHDVSSVYEYAISQLFSTSETYATNDTKRKGKMEVWNERQKGEGASRDVQAESAIFREASKIQANKVVLRLYLLAQTVFRHFDFRINDSSLLRTGPLHFPWGVRSAVSGTA
jgi:hypothetical protein